jgi:hypothetical protein
MHEQRAITVKKTVLIPEILTSKAVIHALSEEFLTPSEDFLTPSEDFLA